MNVLELPTPALVIDADVLTHNLATMAAARPGATLRPHVKAHKCTALAAAQFAHGHHSFTCATPREVLGMVAAELGADLLLANEVLDRDRLRALAAAQDNARITVAVDSPETVAAAAAAGIRNVVSAGGTGTFHLHDRVTEVQAGSYALMDTHYARFGHPFRQAVHVYGTVVSATPKYAVADVGLKSMGMDHGNPSLETLDGNGADVWFLSDEHVTFVPHTGVAAVGDRVRLPPAHIDPTMAMHEVAWVASGHEVIDRWPIDLRNW